MTKLKKIIGIDVSKLTFDISTEVENGKYQVKQYSNNEKGFIFLQKAIPKGSHCIMEATGPYYLRLAMFLHEHGYIVSVLNPLVIKRYSQMKLLRTKTDKADAKLIADYGKSENPPVWEPPKQYIISLQQMESLMLQYQKQHTALNNQLESFEQTGMIENKLKKMIEKELIHLKDQITLLELQMKELIDKYHHEMFEKLTSIPGIGSKTAILLIVITGGFNKFKNYKQLSAYVGLCPRIYDSGTSVKGKRRICKMGMSRIRAMLYICSWSAVKCNNGCKKLYERLLEKGKSKKLALIAVANKLIKQAFAIATQNIYYDENLSKNICF